jgi:type IV pilus assembly protein PilM
VAKQFSKCLGVDIGSSSVKIAECALERGGVRIGKLLRAELPAFPDAEAAEVGTAKIIKDLIKDNKIATREAVFCLGGQQIFSRRVRLPDASEERLARIVDYEARQQIPFPQDKTRIEHQIFRVPGEDEVEVLMVAARKDHIENFMRMVERTGLKAIHLTVSSLALFNYMSYIMSPAIEDDGTGKQKKKRPGKKGKKGKDEGEAPEMELGEEDGGGFVAEEAKAFLNVGESHTDLIIARKAKAISLAFIRSIPIAGKEFSRYIQNSCGLETLAEAERLKREATRAFPPDQPVPNEPGLDAAASEALSDIIDSRLARQIQLSLDYFIAQPDGMAVDEIVVSGGSAQIEGLPEVLEDRLGTNVTRLDEPSIPELQLASAPPAPMAHFGVSVGEAMTGLERGRVKIDFLPERYKIGLDFPRAKVAALAGVLGLMVWLSLSVGGAASRVLNDEAGGYEATIGQLNPQQERIRVTEEDRSKVSVAMDAFLKAFDANNRDRLLRFYADLVETIRSTAANTVLDTLEIGPHGDVIIRGQSQESVAAPNIRQAMIQTMKSHLDLENPPSLEKNDPNAQNIYFFELRARLQGKTSRIVEAPDARRSNAQSGGSALRPRRTPVDDSY